MIRLKTNHLAIFTPVIKNHAIGAAQMRHLRTLVRVNVDSLQKTVASLQIALFELRRVVSKNRLTAGYIALGLVRA